MVRPEGFELPTYRFVACCSIQLSHERPTTANIGKTPVVVKRFFSHARIFFVRGARSAPASGASFFPKALRRNPALRLDHGKNVS